MFGRRNLRTSPRKVLPRLCRCPTSPHTAVPPFRRTPSPRARVPPASSVQKSTNSENPVVSTWHRTASAATPTLEQRGIEESPRRPQYARLKKGRRPYKSIIYLGVFHGHQFMWVRTFAALLWPESAVWPFSRRSAFDLTEKGRCRLYSLTSAATFPESPLHASSKYFVLNTNVRAPGTSVL